MVKNTRRKKKNSVQIEIIRKKLEKIEICRRKKNTKFETILVCDKKEKGDKNNKPNKPRLNVLNNGVYYYLKSSSILLHQIRLILCIATRGR